MPANLGPVARLHADDHPLELPLRLIQDPIDAGAQRRILRTVEEEQPAARRRASHSPSRASPARTSSITSLTAGVS